MTRRNTVHDAIRHRDRALRAARRVTRGVGVGALALTGALSLLAAHAVKGHAKQEPTATTATTAAAPAPARHTVTVPPPQQVPQIDGAPPAPQPPAQAPQPAPAPAPAPAPVVSGGS